MGGAFGSGFAQGFNQSMQQAQDKQLKNIMMQKAKNEIEIQQQLINIRRQMADPNTDDNTLNQLSLTLATLTGKDPFETVMATKMARRFAVNSQPQQVQMPNADGNLVEDPNAPFFSRQDLGMQNPFQSITEGLTSDEADYLFKKTGIGRSQELGPNISNAIDPNTGQRATAQQTKTGQIKGYVPTMPQNIEWVDDPNIPGIQIGYADGRPTGQVRQVAQGYDVKEVKKTLPDGTETTEFIHVPKRPKGIGSPSQAIPQAGTGQFNLDMNSPTIGDDLIKMGTEIKKKGVQGLPGIGGGIQTKPAERAKLLSDKDLADYIDIDTGKRPQGKWTQDSIEASGKYVRKPEKVLSTEEAAKLGNGILAVENIPIVTERLFPNGNLDPKFADDLWAWYKSPALMAKSEAASYGKMIKQAIEANVRLASGANVPPNEIKDRIETYTNQFFSSAEAIATGYNMLYSSLGTNVEIADPTGYYRAVSKKARKPLLEVQKPSLLPKGKGKSPDDATIRKYLSTHGNDPKKAKEAARKDGWKVD